MSDIPNKNYREVSVNDILSMSDIDIKDKIRSIVNVVFRDGVIIDMTPTELIINNIIWTGMIFDKRIKELPIVSKYCMRNYYVNGMFSGATVRNTMTTIVKDQITTLPLDNTRPIILDVIRRKAFETNNLVFNYAGYSSMHGARSIDYIDLLDIQLKKPIMESMDRVSDEMTIKSINDTYDIITDTMDNSKDLENNPVVKAYKSKVVNSRQLMQVLGPRGFVTELDGSIFKYPIASSFSKGLNDMYSFTIESRSAAKALSESGTSISQSEYFGRELQIATMPIEKIHYTDCGSTEFMEWTVRGVEKNNAGDITYNGDQKNLIGKMYKMHPNSPWSFIDNTTSDLSGKTILLRTVQKCKHKDKHGVCAACFGAVSDSIPLMANIGHMCAATLSSRISQAILSTKHLIASASTGDLVLDNIGKMILSIRKNGFGLDREVASKYDKVLLRVSSKEFFGLKTIREVGQVKLLDPSRISKVDSFTIELWKDDKVEKLPIQISQNGKRGVFTDTFIEHVVSNGPTIDEYSNYVINMSNWKPIKAFITLPDVEFSHFALMKQVKTLIMSRTVLKGGVSKDTPESLLTKLFELVNSKLSVNIAMLEVIVYAFTVKDLANGNYDLSRGSTNPQLADIGSLMRNRSLGGTYGMGNLLSNMFRPNIFSPENKPRHPLDVLFFKQEAIDSYKNRNKGTL